MGTGGALRNQFVRCIFEISNLEKLRKSEFIVPRVLKGLFTRDSCFKRGVSSSKCIPVPTTRFPSADETMTRILLL